MRFVFFILLLFYVGDAYAQRSKDQKCLSYWDVGVSECKRGHKETKKQAAPPPVIVQPLPQQPSPVVVIKKPLTEKEKLNVQVEKEVDEFLENHGKPPREFARFMINPTLENALLWVQKYNDMLKRTEETSIAWMKAQHIWEQNQKGELNADIPTLENKRRVVPDYGLQWSDEVGEFQSSQPEQMNAFLTNNTQYMSDDGSITAPAPSQMPQFNVQALDDPKQQMKELFAVMQQMKQQKQNSIKSDRNAAADVATGGDIKKLLPNAEKLEDGKIHVNYYFSAECPYCKKFEPELQTIIEELGSKITVTCVDMTPSTKDIVNIYGKVDCDWRPLQPDEMQTFGIKSTPTLLVNFPNKSKVERLEGAVTASVLRDYLK